MSAPTAPVSLVAELRSTKVEGAAGRAMSSLQWSEGKRLLKKFPHKLVS